MFNIQNRNSFILIIQVHSHTITSNNNYIIYTIFFYFLYVSHNYIHILDDILTTYVMKGNTLIFNRSLMF